VCPPAPASPAHLAPAQTPGSATEPDRCPACPAARIGTAGAPEDTAARGPITTAALHFNLGYHTNVI